MKQLTMAILFLLIGSLAQTGAARAQDAEPGDAILAVVEQARTSLAEGDPVAAIARLEPLVNDPAAPSVVRELLGAIYLTAGRPGDALEMLEPLAEAGEPDPVVLLNLARALLELGRMEEGETQLERAVALAPRSPGAVTLARLRAAAGDHQDAVRLLEPLVDGSSAEAMERADPSLASRVAASFARSLIELGQTERALPYLERVTRLSRSEPQAWEQLGKALVELGRQDKAQEALAQARSLNESQLSAELENAAKTERLLQLALALRADGQLEEALATLRQAIEGNPGEIGNLLLEVRLLIDLKRDVEALERAERVVAMTRGRVVEAFHLRAAAKLGVRDLEGAEYDFRYVLEQAPDHRDAMNGLGLVLIVTGRVNEAEELLTHLLERWPDDPIASDNLERLRKDRQSP